MTNAKNKKIIKIWGVTIPAPEFRFEPQGFGFRQTNAGYMAYTEIRITDLVTWIKAQGLRSEIIKKLK